ncbi:MAG: sigma 54-interacting transcriptional regulator [Deltaproteobacteria bacterium]|jgi:PAS domain S-box-containing protein|nr:sigma 54-interacting transcriptional regulator [Deltaproteobacteria bacterium]
MSGQATLKAGHAAIQACCREMTASVANCLKEAICVIDAAGDVIVWNDGAEALYALRRAEVLGHNIKQFFPDALIEQIRLSRIQQENVYHSPRAGTHILITVMPLYIDGIFSGAVSCDRDYSEMRKLYNELDNAEQQLLLLKKEISKITDSFGQMVGISPNFRRKVELARQIATTDANVLLTGESGTGKEVFARGIHEQSGRKGLFAPVNCSAIPQGLFESEFFGYSPGAFTGANRKGRSGIFEMANGGTVFLDEIGDMPMFMQSKLLRVLQEREIIRVGGDRTVKLDVRVISAANKSLRDLVAKETFREDLFYRLNVVEIELPPLRERKEDIPLLVDLFSRNFAAKNGQPLKFMASEVINKFVDYSWPGNIRELMNVVENMVVTGKNDLLFCKDIPDYILNRMEQHMENRPSSQLDLVDAVKKLEKNFILKAVSLSNYNKSRAASLLNIPRATLYHKAGEYGIKLSK